MRTPTEADLLGTEVAPSPLTTSNGLCDECVRFSARNFLLIPSCTTMQQCQNLASASR